MSRIVHLFVVLLALSSGMVRAQDHEDRLVLLPRHDWTVQGLGGRYGYAEVQWVYLGDHSRDHSQHYFFVAGRRFVLTRYHAAFALVGAVALLLAFFFGCRWTRRAPHGRQQAQWHNKRPGVDAGWTILFAFPNHRPRATQAER